jgi:hypothetical protein
MFKSKPAAQQVAPTSITNQITAWGERRRGLQPNRKGVCGEGKGEAGSSSILVGRGGLCVGLG